MALGVDFTKLCSPSKKTPGVNPIKNIIFAVKIESLLHVEKMHKL